MTFDQRQEIDVNQLPDDGTVSADVMDGAAPVDAELAKLASAGDRDAFAQLLDRHYDLIYRTAFKWCGHQSDAEDVAQDVCVKLARVLESFDGRSAFSSWLYRITLNMVHDMQRARSRQHKRQADFLDVAESDAPPDQEEKTTEGELWRAVRALPEKQRDAVLLIYGEDVTHAAAAEIMNVKESTISWYVHEARKTLKGLL